MSQHGHPTKQYVLDNEISDLRTKVAEQETETKKETMANEDFTSQLIKSLNKDYKTKVAYNLSEDESPTQVKRWVSTGSKLSEGLSSIGTCPVYFRMTSVSLGKSL